MRRVSRRRGEDEAQGEQDESPGIHRRPRRQETEPVVEIKHDVINERVILATALVDNEERRKLCRRFPNTDAFGGKNNRPAWAIVLELERRGLSYDPATVRAIDPGVDTDDLDDLVRERPAVPPNLDAHVEMLEWDRQRVDIAKGPLTALVELIRDRTTPPEKVRAVMAQLGRFASESNTDVRRFVRSTKALIEESMRDIAERRRGRAIFPFGIEGVDSFESGEPRAIPGAAPKHITVVTGISGGGKSTWVKNFAVAQARLGRRVSFGAWEEGDSPTLEELALISLGMNRGHARAGRLDDDQVASIALEEERMGDYVTFVTNPFERSSRERRQKAASNDRNLDLLYEITLYTRAEVFICDLWERCIPQQDPDQITDALYRQQDIAKETACHFALVQQQRLKDVETRADKRPTRDGLKGSSAWVDVATTIVGVHNPSKFKQVEDNRIENIFLKQRFGVWPLLVELQYDPAEGRLWGGKSVEYRHAGEGDEMGIGEELRRGSKRGRARS